MDAAESPPISQQKCTKKHGITSRPETFCFACKCSVSFLRLSLNDMKILDIEFFGPEIWLFFFSSRIAPSDPSVNLQVYCHYVSFLFRLVLQPVPPPGKYKSFLLNLTIRNNSDVALYEPSEFRSVLSSCQFARLIGPNYGLSTISRVIDRL